MEPGLAAAEHYQTESLVSRNQVWSAGTGQNRYPAQRLSCIRVQKNDSGATESSSKRPSDDRHAAKSEAR
ncbi:hypothetical protein C8035_v003281 [Colletotrichum spinosum]|uniref:Uncharacterized protein n=1 Tax=Colletotrichum spinosum TaxID=1347390 RepID=A0A4R8QKC0_9PEZI|nr:hypothetical protein C8035_v003281 [Colletotrichum spinosum]